MTGNQIDYAKHKEIQLHNRNVENQARLDLYQKQAEAAEQARHNLATEGEANRHNLASEALQNLDINQTAANVQSQNENRIAVETLSQKGQNKRNAADNKTKKQIAKSQNATQLQVSLFGLEGTKILAATNDLISKRDNKTKKWIATQTPDAQLKLQKIIESQAVTESTLAAIKRDDLDSESKRALNSSQQSLNKANTYRSAAETALAKGNTQLALKKLKLADKEFEQVKRQADARMIQALARLEDAKSNSERRKYQNIYDGFKAGNETAQQTRESLKPVMNWLSELLKANL